MAGPMRSDELSAVKPPRPPNSWILYRAHVLKNLPPPGPGEPRRSQSDVSALVSRMWKQESEEVKAYFERMAEEAKAQHKIQFPNYRYQPKKKEEKERLRELQKKQKESERLAKKTRRIGQASDSPALSTSRSFLLPGAPYFNPHVLYNSVGPSPPLSASSSPSDAISSPLVGSSSVPTAALKVALAFDAEEVTKSTPSSSILPPLTLPTTLNPPTNTLPSSDAKPPSSLIASSSYQVETIDTAWHLENQSLLSEELISNIDPAKDNWDSTVLEPALEQSTTSGSLLFSLPHDQVSWLQEDPQTYGNRSLPTQNDAVYRLDGFDPSILTLDPQGEVEVSLGGLPAFHDSNLFETLFPPNDDFLSSMPPLTSDPHFFGIPHSNDLTNLFFNFHEQSYPNAEASASQPTPEPSAPQQQVTSASSASYTPPSGAAYSSTRRVAGNWANSIYAREELLPQSPPVHAN